MDAEGLPDQWHAKQRALRVVRVVGFDGHVPGDGLSPVSLCEQGPRACLSIRRHDGDVDADGRRPRRVDRPRARRLLGQHGQHGHVPRQRIDVLQRVRRQYQRGESRSVPGRLRADIATDRAAVEAAVRTAHTAAVTPTIGAANTAAIRPTVVTAVTPTVGAAFATALAAANEATHGAADRTASAAPHLVSFASANDGTDEATDGAAVTTAHTAANSSALTAALFTADGAALTAANDAAHAAAIGTAIEPADVQSQSTAQ
jgi:hypothetical protein